MIVIRGRSHLDVISGKARGERAGERCIYVENRNEQRSEMICEPVKAAGYGDGFVKVAPDWLEQNRFWTLIVGLFWSL